MLLCVLFGVWWLGWCVCVCVCVWCVLCGVCCLVCGRVCVWGVCGRVCGVESVLCGVCCVLRGYVWMGWGLLLCLLFSNYVPRSFVHLVFESALVLVEYC